MDYFFFLSEPILILGMVANKLETIGANKPVIKTSTPIYVRKINTIEFNEANKTSKNFLGCVIFKFVKL